MEEARDTAKQNLEPTFPSDRDVACDSGGRVSHKSGEGQMTVSEVCSKCPPIKIIVSQVSEFVVNLTH